MVDCIASFAPIPILEKVETMLANMKKKMTEWKYASHIV